LEQVIAMVVQDVERMVSSVPGDATSGVHCVLVAFDGSAGAWVALRRAIEVAVANHALLTIAAVVEEPLAIWMGFGAMTVPVTRESLRRDLEHEMRLHLAEARDEVPATVSVTTRMLHGRAARALAELVEAGGYDLVVTGPRPLGRLGRLLRHSVTHRLLSRTHTSVLAVKT
jgi:nucleotide-binding universal stress UspA family protein